MTMPSSTRFDSEVASVTHERWLNKEAGRMLDATNMGADRLCTWQGSVYGAFEMEDSQLQFERVEQDWGLSRLTTDDEPEALPSLIIQSCWSQDYPRMLSEMKTWMQKGAGEVQMAILLKWKIVLPRNRRPVLHGEFEVFEYVARLPGKFKRTHYERISSEEEPSLASIKITPKQLFGGKPQRGLTATYQLSLDDLWDTALDIFDIEVEEYELAHPPQERPRRASQVSAAESQPLTDDGAESLSGTDREPSEPDTEDGNHDTEVTEQDEQHTGHDGNAQKTLSTTIQHEQVGMLEQTLIETQAQTVSQTTEFETVEVVEILGSITTTGPPAPALHDQLSEFQEQAVQHIRDVADAATISASESYTESEAASSPSLQWEILKDEAKDEDVVELKHIEGRSNIQEYTFVESEQDTSTHNYHETHIEETIYTQAAEIPTISQPSTFEFSITKDAGSANSTTQKFEVSYDESLMLQQPSSSTAMEAPGQCSQCLSEQCCHGQNPTLRHLPPNFMSAGVIGPFSWCGFVVYISLSTLQTVSQETVESSRPMLLERLQEFTEDTHKDFPAEDVGTPALMTGATKTAITEIIDVSKTTRTRREETSKVLQKQGISEWEKVSKLDGTPDETDLVGGKRVTKETTTAFSETKLVSETHLTPMLGDGLDHDFGRGFFQSPVLNQGHIVGGPWGALGGGHGLATSMEQLTSAIGEQGPRGGAPLSITIPDPPGGLLVGSSNVKTTHESIKTTVNLNDLTSPLELSKEVTAIIHEDGLVTQELIIEQNEVDLAEKTTPAPAHSNVVVGLGILDLQQSVTSEGLLTTDTGSEVHKTITGKQTVIIDETIGIERSGLDTIIGDDEPMLSGDDDSSLVVHTDTLVNKGGVTTMAGDDDSSLVVHTDTLVNKGGVTTMVGDDNPIGGDDQPMLSEDPVLDGDDYPTLSAGYVPTLEMHTDSKSETREFTTTIVTQGVQATTAVIIPGPAVNVTVIKEELHYDEDHESQYHANSDLDPDAWTIGSGDKEEEIHSASELEQEEEEDIDNDGDHEGTGLSVTGTLPNEPVAGVPGPMQRLRLPMAKVIRRTNKHNRLKLQRHEFEFDASAGGVDTGTSSADGNDHVDEITPGTEGHEIIPSAASRIPRRTGTRARIQRQELTAETVPAVGGAKRADYERVHTGNSSRRSRLRLQRHTVTETNTNVDGGVPVEGKDTEDKDEIHSEDQLTSESASASVGERLGKVVRRKDSGISIHSLAPKDIDDHDHDDNVDRDVDKETTEATGTEQAEFSGVGGFMRVVAVPAADSRSTRRRSGRREKIRRESEDSGSGLSVGLMNGSDDEDRDRDTAVLTPPLDSAEFHAETRAEIHADKVERRRMRTSKKTRFTGTGGSAAELEPAAETSLVITAYSDASYVSDSDSDHDPAQSQSHNHRDLHHFESSSSATTVTTTTGAGTASAAVSAESDFTHSASCIYAGTATQTHEGLINCSCLLDNGPQLAIPPAPAPAPAQTPEAILAQLQALLLQYQASTATAGHGGNPLIPKFNINMLCEMTSSEEQEEELEVEITVRYRGRAERRGAHVGACVEQRGVWGAGGGCAFVEVK